MFVASHHNITKKITKKKIILYPQHPSSDVPALHT